MKETGRSRKVRTWQKVLIALAVLAVCAGLGLAGFSIYGNYQMSKIPGLSFREALEYTTKDNAAAVITVGIVRNGSASYTVYGENGAELPHEAHTYEIGSLTKTFTAALVSRAVREGKLDLDAEVGQYLSLPEGNTYPTVAELLTHTSGYKGYYFEAPMIANFLTGRNDFYGITKAMAADRAGKVTVPGESYPFNYSNFGYAVLGLVLEAAYGRDYTALVNELAGELGLAHTHISTGDGDLGRYWDWNEGDAYLSAGGLTSDIGDMLAYTQAQLDGPKYVADCHRSLREIDAASEQYRMLGIGMDEIGMAWIVDKKNGVIWHNGGTGNYNSYLGFAPETGTAVVVLSNLPPSYRIPATVLGVKLLDELRGAV